MQHIDSNAFDAIYEYPRDQLLCNICVGPKINIGKGFTTITMTRPKKTGESSFRSCCSLTIRFLSVKRVILIMYY